MKKRVELHVDQISIAMDLSEAEAERLTSVLKTAFEDLAKRLQTSPVTRFRSPTRLALGELRVEALPTNELLGPRGAARLADIFWEQLTTSRSTS